MPGNELEPNRIPAKQPETGMDDWTEPRELTIPDPTYWPAVLALGVMFILWGIVTMSLVSLIGFVLFAIALAGWIGELRHEYRNRNAR